jgi:DNA-binding MurR/RpiR family transcriptional regulator
MRIKAPADHAALTERIRAVFPELSPQFQAGARYLSDHPDRVAVSSMRTLAAEAGVQSSTLVRLAQHLGFDGWPDLKALYVARVVHAVPRGYAKKAESITRQKASGGLIAGLFEAQRQNLSRTEARNAAALPAVAKTIAAARQVHVAGFRASYPIAFSFHYLYRLFRASVQLINGHAGTLEMSLRAIEAKDVVIVASFAPYSTEARLVADAAQAAGATLVAITDSAVAPIALHADAVLDIAVESPSFFPSVVSAIGVVESLVEMLVSCHGADAVKRIDAAEAQLFDMGAYERQ